MKVSVLCYECVVSMFWWADELKVALGMCSIDKNTGIPKGF